MVYKPQSNALGSLPPGASPFQQIQKINTGLKEIRPGPLQLRTWSFFLTFLSEPPTPGSLPTPFTASSSCHGAWDSCSGVHHHTVHIVLCKMQRCLGKGYITSLWPWNELTIRSHLTGTNVLWGKNTRGNNVRKGAPDKRP